MKKILVVDDTKNIRMLLSKCLELEGYEVDTAADGLQAIGMFKAKEYDLVFLDIKLPEMSGTEVLKRMRENGISTPVIIITAYATVKNAVDCTKLGAVAYLQKPFTCDKIITVLEESRVFSDETGKSEDKETLSSAKRLIEEEKYNEALEILRAGAAKELENPEIYLLISEAFKGIGNAKMAEKFYNTYKLFQDNA